MAALKLIMIVIFIAGSASGIAAETADELLSEITFYVQ